jgi:UrcA family protein
MSKSKTPSASSSLGRRLAGLALFAGMASAAGPIAAQSLGAQTVADELTVTGRYGVGPNVRSLSTAVSYRDLDLTTQAGRDALSQRVRAAARDLCRRLGEPGNLGTAAAPSCERDAINSTRDQQRLAAANAVSPAYAAVPPAPAPAPLAPAAESYGQAASVTTETVANQPVRDTPENRAAYGGPMSNGGRRTTPAGN